MQILNYDHFEENADNMPETDGFRDRYLQHMLECGTAQEKKWAELYIQEHAKDLK